MLSPLNRLVSFLEEAVVGLLLTAASLILFADVAARFLFNTSFSWAAESVRYAIVWTVFIGASIAFRQGVHISIDALRLYLPARAATGVSLLALTLSFVFCALLLWYGLGLVQTMRGFSQVSPAMQVPMWWVYLALPVGAALMLLRLLQIFWGQIFRAPPVPSAPDRPAAE